MKLVIVSGLSGSGKSIALNMLEDLGHYCIDNLPVTLIEKVAAATIQTGDSRYELMALGVDARNRSDKISQLGAMVERLRAGGIDCTLLYLHASEDKLFTRYSESRRKHPLSSGNMTLRDAMDAERALLSAVAEQADLTIDTTHTTIHDLRHIIHTRVHDSASDTLSILIESFAFRHGVPADADFVFDARCLPNPYWEAQLRPHSGREPQVVDFLNAQPEVGEMLADITRFLSQWIPRFKAHKRSYLTIAIGCTGGFHRSVYLAEKLAKNLAQHDDHIVVRHNETDVHSPSAAR